MQDPAGGTGTTLLVVMVLQTMTIHGVMKWLILIPLPLRPGFWVTSGSWRDATPFLMNFFVFVEFRHIFELPSFVDDFWSEINSIIEELGIPRFQPDNIAFSADRVDPWHLRKTQENIDKFVNYMVALVKLLSKLPERELPR